MIQPDATPGAKPLNATPLTKAQRAVLGIYARYGERRLLYWGSPKTTGELEAMGLVERFTPPSVAERRRMKARPCRITDLGLQALKETDHDH